MKKIATITTVKNLIKIANCENDLITIISKKDEILFSNSFKQLKSNKDLIKKPVKKMYCSEGTWFVLV